MRFDSDAQAIISATHGDPFSYLGPHESSDGRLVIRAFDPDAQRVELVHATGHVPPQSIAARAGLFEIELGEPTLVRPYRLRMSRGGSTSDIIDPYQFGPWIGDDDRYLWCEGTHLQAYDRLGAHVIQLDGVDGVVFVMWAPNATRVSVVGDFNQWDGRRHPMRRHAGAGLWEIFVPGLGGGERYKFEIRSRSGHVLPLKADPLAFGAERPPATASVVRRTDKHQWHDETWMAARAERDPYPAPMLIYEAHLGSWRRRPEEQNRWLSYRELAETLVPYVQQLGFTHIELMPVTEFPFDGSWGYQPISLYAPTSRFGTPQDFQAFVDSCHRAGLGVILDWVPGHFPNDAHGLADFDGTKLYEHADPRQGLHPDWNTLIYNYGRAEVAEFLVNSALFWLERYHVDGLRVDAVSSMLYLDYSRKPGEWVPNRFGGNENLDAIELLRRFNAVAYGKHPGIVTIAEESTAWPNVSRPTHDGGLGFGFKWNMGWMHDTLRYMSEDPINRRHHHDKLTFGLVYAFSENFILPLSHDEVVHGKRSILGRMPGDSWQRFANLRAYYGFMYGHPGKKLLFMGDEFGQECEWDHDRGLDWHLLSDPRHQGVWRVVQELNHLVRRLPALHERDHDPAGFAWIDASDQAASVLSFERRGLDPDAHIVIIANFTPVPRHAYRIGMPSARPYLEIFNSDDARYGGSGMGNPGLLHPEPVTWHGRAQSRLLTLPPLATIFLVPAHG